MTQTKKQNNAAMPHTNHKTRKHTQHNYSPTSTQKELLSAKIRHYSRDEIERDFSKLVEIGCKAKHQSNKKLTGNRVVDAFTFTERLNTIGSKGISFYEFWQTRNKYSRKNYVKKYIEFANKQHKQTPEKVWYNLYRFYFTSINCFRPLVAMEYYCMFSPKCVLDMTAGWGGRLVGACALNIPKYIGIDNNPALEKPYKKMVEFLRPHTKTEMDIRIENALDVDYSKLEYDMVFTSPPYYDLEIYGVGGLPPHIPHATDKFPREGGGMVKNSGDGSNESIMDAVGLGGRIPLKEDWDTNFYRPLFKNTYQHLAIGGHYCLNIPTEIFERVCLPLFGKPTQIIPLKKSDRRSASSKKYTEYVYVWNKQTR